jgi:hypothetical protein
MTKLNLALRAKNRAARYNTRSGLVLAKAMFARPEEVQYEVDAAGDLRRVKALHGSQDKAEVRAFLLNKRALEVADVNENLGGTWAEWLVAQGYCVRDTLNPRVLWMTTKAQKNWDLRAYTNDGLRVPFFPVA